MKLPGYVKIRAFSVRWLLSGKEDNLSLSVLSSFPNWSIWAWQQNPCSSTETTQTGPEKGEGISYMAPSALNNLNFPQAHHIPWMLYTQVFDLCFEDSLKAKDRAPSNLQHKSEQTCWLHDLFISYNQLLQCPPIYFHT